MDIVTIDFETYYDKDYSLSKMTTESYIRNPLFEVIGVGIKVNDYPTDWYSGENVGRFLKSLDYSKRAILCHNTVFDGAILSWHFGIRPRLWLDTLSMARPKHQAVVGGSLAKLAAYYGLGQKGDEVVAAIGKRRMDFTPEELARYGEYCRNDVDLTYALWNKLRVGFPVSELMMIDKTLRMYIEPQVELDRELLEQHLVNVRARKAELMSKVEADMDTIMSNNHFAAYLESLGVDPPRKISPRTGQTTWAFSKTDKGLTDLLEHPDERVQAVVAARIGVKSTLEETRTEALIGVSQRGRLPIMLNYYGAHTGRYSGGDRLNLQNLPSRTGDKSLKRSLRAPEGRVFIAADSSQIEARLVAYVAGQDDLVQAFREKRDVYSEFASEVYGRPITKADKLERFVGKTCILGLGYGMGAEKLRTTLELGQGGMKVNLLLDEAMRIVSIYRNKNPRIAALWNRCGNMLNDMIASRHGGITEYLPYDPEGIKLPNGLRLAYPGLQKHVSGLRYIADPRSYQKYARAVVLGEEVDASVWTRIYGGKAVENLIQALAALVIREQMLAISQHYPLVFQVHDEIIISAPKEEKEKAEAKLVEVMSTPPKWAPGLPVACESGAADNYGDT